MSTDVKQQVIELAQRLAHKCTWDDVLCNVHVLQKIRAGLNDVEAGRVINHEEVFAEAAAWSNG